jgi:hypothetical protein
MKSKAQDLVFDFIADTKKEVSLLKQNRKKHISNIGVLPEADVMRDFTQAVKKAKRKIASSSKIVKPDLTGPISLPK